MVDTNSPEFVIGKKIGHLFMTYLGIRMVIKGTKIILKSGRVLLMTSPIIGATPL